MLRARIEKLEHQLEQERQRRLSLEQRLARELQKTEQRIRGHLSYRLGREIVRCGTSPLAWAQLPFRLGKAYREYRTAAKGRNSSAPAKNGHRKQWPSATLEDYAAAQRLLYRDGNITAALSMLEKLEAQGIKFDKSERDFKAFVQGLARLKNGWTLPPRQPNPGMMTRRRHLLYCLHQSLPHSTNGYSTRSHGIAAGLQKAGWRVRATTRPGFPWDAKVKGLDRGYHEAEVDGVTYAAAAGWDLNRTPLDYYFADAADHFFREAQTCGAEIIVAASNHVTAIPALTAARRLGLPFVYEVRGLWEVTQASVNPAWAHSERYQLMRSLEQQAAREADIVVTLTEELADELVSWGVPRERVVIVPNAVDAERFQPMEPDPELARELDLTPGIPVIGYAGSAVAYEGLELLLEALAQLKEAGQAFRFVLVGDGKVIEAVKERAKVLGLEQHCRFTGRVPFDQVPRYLSCMDIMPIPRLSSAVTEMVSALKPLEAMAMGKAVVLSDVAPHKVMAGYNERARLFTKGSAEDLCSVLQTLIADPEERQRLGRAARDWIEQERTWNHVTRIYGEALQRVRTEAGSPRTAVEPGAIKRLEHITLGLIADRFTTDTLASAVKVVPLSPENWQQELAQQPIDALFIESAWEGNDGQWHRKVGYYSEEEFAPLSALLDHCRRRGIPSLFWNKEDPVHFERFRRTASLCDHVFTTDSRRIIPYLATPGTLTRTASSCPFYASPKIHNLLPSSRDWQPTAAYGGTYYGGRYPERTEYLDKIMSAAAPLGVTIYDRQHDDPDSPYKYPDGLACYVAGALSYSEMIQAYKSHPVQINVNSVLDSPTMFSRRVFEAAACGAAIVSGPSLGISRYLDSTAQVVQTESEAAEALENLLHNPAYRWRITLKAARAVMRAHTTGHRLAQMLRTTGLKVVAPELPVVNVFTPTLTEKAAKRLLHQTLRPHCVVAQQCRKSTQEKLERAGVGYLAEERCTTAHGSLWLLADAPTLEGLEPEDLEDLAWAAAYAPQNRIGFIRDVAPGKDRPSLAVERMNLSPGPELVRARAGMRPSSIRLWAQEEHALALRKPSKTHDHPPRRRKPRKTIVIAGHDLKFIKPFYPYFTKEGYRLLLDFWNGHSQHNEQVSHRLLLQADAVFCEWMLGNAIWYGKHKMEWQKLLGRLHAQELRSPLFEKVPFDAFEAVIFVGPHVLRSAQMRNMNLKKNGILIHNAVDVQKFSSVPRKQTSGKTLGLVGIVPRSKRLDRALNILRLLRQSDHNYILRIKGKKPHDYPWMMERVEEMRWYEDQFARLESDPLLSGAVFFDQHGDDMAEWYAGIDYILSVSDHESFHLAVAEGAASGCTPVILPWEGASEIYPGEWIFASESDAASRILSPKPDRNNASAYIADNFDLPAIAAKMLSVQL